MSEKPIFNVAGLLRDPVGATRPMQVDAALDDLIPGLRDELGQSDAEIDITGPIRLMHITDGVLVQGNLAAAVTVPCVRCLEPANVELEIEVEETFVPTIDIVTGQAIQPEELDQSLWIDEHHILDLSEALRQNLLVSLPVHVVCNEACKGLCVTCGENLNEGPCNCTEEIDPRWAALRGLLDETDHRN